MILDNKEEVFKRNAPENLSFRNSIKKCPFLQEMQDVQVTNFISGQKNVDVLHHQSDPIKCQKSFCYGSLMAGQSVAPVTCRPPAEMLSMAKTFLKEYYSSNKSFTQEDFDKRVEQVTEEIESKETYELTIEELRFGAKLGWRNASRCIGRIQWNKLEIQDCRDITSTAEMYDALCKHLEYATNGGNIRSMITVFPKRVKGREDFRMWNPQIINYAGYLQADGSVIGDPGRVMFTRICQRLGWKGKGGRFDILPWVVSAPGEGVKWYEVPVDLVLMIKLEHPKYPWFGDMGIKWYAVPAVADMLFDVGGLNFPAAPFNGWYMGTEVGARNLCDPQRYNITNEVAKKMGLDTSTPITLWKDLVLVEINVAVLYSFGKQGVTIVDHHTAAETFMKHMANEQKVRGGCPADWVWICPPISGSITPVYHQEMICYNLKPSYEYQTKAWITYKWPKNSNLELKYTLSAVSKAILCCVYLMSKVSSQRMLATILYATETGKSETLAQHLGQLLQASFRVNVMCMEDYDAKNLVKENLVFIVASTFGSGEPPDNGKAFFRALKKMKQEKISLNNLKFSVFALGSSHYPSYCKFGKNVDETLFEMGGHRLLNVSLGDELKGQEHTFNDWLPNIYETACKSCSIKAVSSDVLPVVQALNRWNPENFRLAATTASNSNYITELPKLHNKKGFPLKMLSRARLQSCDSEKQTLLIRLVTDDKTVLDYEPGDHLGIFPSNPEYIVSPILKRLKENGNSTSEVLTLEIFKEGDWQATDRLPPSTMKTYLTHYLDISSSPSPYLLQMMSYLSTNSWDKYRLKRLATVTEEYEEWTSFRSPHLAEILEEFPSVQMNASLLIRELPLLQPRYYSISSSPDLNKGQVHLTATIVSYRTMENRGAMHRGVCTSFLNSFPDEEMPCFIRSAPTFRLPNDTSLPVVMIGAGSGIAPYRSFWQHRDLQVKNAKTNGTYKSDTFGPMILFFGCREAKVDNIYEQETAPLVRKGILTSVFTALSREPKQPKCYVQHELEKQGDLLKDLITKGGHLYVCGDSIMADEVKNSLNKVTEEKLQITIESLADSGRYHEDVFGILHR